MRIVLVDPSRTMLKIVTRMLESRDHEVLAFIDAGKALDCIRTDRRVDALITSAEPKSMSGIELCWEARLLAGGQRPIHIIMMSSDPDRERLVKALDCGADDFIGKPPIPEELYARLRVAERLAAVQNDLIRMATTDELSGLPNRRAFFAAGKQICDRAGIIGALSAIMIDIDHFKRINDEHGHDSGDDAIRRVASVIAAAGENVGRLGGEEFALLLDGQSMVHAVELADRLRRKCEDLRFQFGAQAVTLTCSFGVSDWQPGDTIDTLLRRADVALYAAKTGGRNRVVAADAAFWQQHCEPPGGTTRSSLRPDAAAAPARAKIAPVRQGFSSLAS